MKRVIRLALLLTVFGFSTVHAAESYLRAIISNVSPSTEGYSSAVAGGVSVGFYWGSKGQHEINYEWGYTHWDSEGMFSNMRYAMRETFMPHLINYRFNLRLSESNNYSWYFGPSLGFTNSKVELEGASGSQRVSFSQTDWSFTFGGTTGINLRLTDRIDLDLGYRYLSLKGAKYTASGVTLETKNAHASIVYAGIGFRF